MKVTISDFEKDVRKYIPAVGEPSVFITKDGDNGTVIARLEAVSPRKPISHADRMKALRKLQELFKGVNLSDADVERLRDERLGLR